MKVHAGPTNFFLVDTARPSQPLQKRLLERGISVASMDAYGMTTCLRITVGLPEENQRIVSALADLLNERARVP